MNFETDRTSNSLLRSGGKTLIFILSAAFLLRIVNLIFVANSDLVRIPIIDSAFYQRWAQAISQGDLIGDKIFFMSPLYPYLMGFIYMLSGPNPIFMLLLQVLLGTATVLLVYLIAHRLLDRRRGLIAAGITAVYTPFIFYEVTLLTSTVILFLSTLILKFTIDTIDRDKSNSLWMLGIAIGLSALARPLVLLYLPVLYLLYLAKDRDTFVRRGGVVTAAVLLILIPVSVRNLIVGGEFTLTTSSAGMNFYVGNNPDANGLYWEAPFLSSAEPEFEDEDYRKIASQASERDLTTREAGKFWFNRSLQWIVDEPASYLKLLGKKALYFWNRAEFANNVSIYLGKDVSPLLRFNPVGFWLIAPLGLAGLILMWRKEGWVASRVPILWVATYFAGAMIFFVASEYRLPAVLALIIGAAYFLTELIDRLRTRKAEAVMNVVALGLVFGAFSNFRTSFIYEGENSRMDWFNMGNTLLKADLNQEAIKRFQKSLEVDPHFPEGMLRLAEAYARSGDSEKAIEIGKRVGMEEPEKIMEIVKGLALTEAYALLDEGKLSEAMGEFVYSGIEPEVAAAETTRVSILIKAQNAYKSGNHPEALKLYKEIADNDSIPDHLILNNIAYIHWQGGATDSAEYYVDRAMAADSTAPQVIMLKSRILRAAGRVEEAEKMLLRADPNAGNRFEILDQVHVEMDSLTELGEWVAALEAYGKYGKIGFDPIPEDKLRIGRLQYEIGNFEHAYRLLTEAEEEGIETSDLYLWKGLALAALGKSKEAEVTLQEAVQMDRENVSARMAAARFYLNQNRIEAARRELRAVAHLEIIDSNLRQKYSILSDSLKGM